MTTQSSTPPEPPASPLLKPVLRFIAFCIETPATAAVRIAAVMTLLALLIHTKAIILGASATGTGFAVLYATSAWGIALYLRAQERGRNDDT